MSDYNVNILCTYNLVIAILQTALLCVCNCKTAETTVANVISSDILLLAVKKFMNIF